MAPHPKPGPKKKKKRQQDKKYQAFIRSQLCCACGKIGSQHHHESLSGGVMGGKVSDYESLPLCYFCHHLRHVEGRETFYKSRGIDYKEEILKLQRRFEDGKI